MALTDLVLLIQGAIELISPQAGERNISIHFDPPSSPCEIVVDPERLRQVLVNLLSNAVKYNQRGRRRHNCCRTALRCLAHLGRKTPGKASSRRTSTRFLTSSIAARRKKIRSKAPAWAYPSSNRSSNCTMAPSTSRANPVQAAPSSCPSLLRRLPTFPSSNGANEKAATRRIPDRRLR